MKKANRGIWLGMVLVTVLMMIAPATVLAPKMERYPDENTLDGKANVIESDSNISFYGRSSSNWYAIKVYSSSTIYIEKLYCRQFLWSEKAKTDIQGLFITNLKNATFYWVGTQYAPYLFKEDRFFHIQVGPFNFTYKHIILEEDYFGGLEIWDSFHLFPDTWYFIVMGQTLGERTTKCETEIWINTTGNVEFLGTTEGNDTFFYIAEDFLLGNLNLLWGKNVKNRFVINGEKLLTITNTFIGYLIPCQTWGIEKFQWINPEGDMKESTIIYKGRDRKIMGDDPRSPIIGSSGTWEFRINCFMMGKSYLPYGTYFIYADVKLP